jgi:ligand-binding sensor domain-containing protein
MNSITKTKNTLSYVIPILLMVISVNSQPEWIVYDTTNSGLPHNWVSSVTIDDFGNKWIGTFAGLAKFDGAKWKVYDTSNSDLPSNEIISIALDNSGDFAFTLLAP